MNKCVAAILILLAATVARSDAGTPPLPWGPPTNGIQLSLTVNASTNPPDTNQTLLLVIRIRNLSHRTLSFESFKPLDWLSFDIRSPSGRDLSPRPHEPMPGSRQYKQLQTNQEFAYRPILLASICDLSEPGTYTIVVRQKVFWDPAFVVTSNPLAIIVPPSAPPKPPSATNAPGKSVP